MSKSAGRLGLDSDSACAGFVILTMERSGYLSEFLSASVQVMTMMMAVMMMVVLMTMMIAVMMMMVVMTMMMMTMVVVVVMISLLNVSRLL